MENVDRHVLDTALQENFRIKKLYSQHLELDQKITAFENRSFLTDQEQLHIRQLKKEKLRGKEELIKLIEEYQNGRMVKN